jgi:plasmid stabilization system protein ParE
MPHRLASEAEADLDEIWLYTAKESGSVEIADRLIDSITERFLLLARHSPEALSRPLAARRMRTLEAGNTNRVYWGSTTDLAKTVSGSDRVLLHEHFDRGGLRAKIQHFRPKILAFTGKRSGEVFIAHPVKYGLSKETIGSPLLFVLPSPSGAARRRAPTTKFGYSPRRHTTGNVSQSMGSPSRGAP